MIRPLSNFVVQPDPRAISLGEQLRKSSFWLKLKTCFRSAPSRSFRAEENHSEGFGRCSYQHAWFHGEHLLENIVSLTTSCFFATLL